MKRPGSRLQFLFREKEVRLPLVWQGGDIPQFQPLEAEVMGEGDGLLGRHGDLVGDGADAGRTDVRGRALGER